MPLYHRPKPLPLLPARGVVTHSYFQRPVPFKTKAGLPLCESSTFESSKPKEPVPYFSLLAGVAIGLLVFTGFALTLLMASMVWSSPNRSWFLAGLFVAYLTGTVATSRAVGRRLRAWRPWEELQLRLRSDRQNLDHLFKSAQPGRLPSASDF